MYSFHIHHFVSNLNDVFALSDTTMSQTVKLRVILEARDIRKLDLPQGVPGTVNELECERHLGSTRDFLFITKILILERNFFL